MGLKRDTYSGFTEFCVIPAKLAGATAISTACLLWAWDDLLASDDVSLIGDELANDDCSGVALCARCFDLLD